MSRLPLMLKSEEGPILRIYAFEPGRIAVIQEMHDGMKVEARLDVVVTTMIRDALDGWLRDQKAEGQG